MPRYGSRDPARRSHERRRIRVGLHTGDSRLDARRQSVTTHQREYADDSPVRALREGAMNIVDLFSRQVSERPERIAIIHRDRQVTFSELDAESRGVAQSLALDGLGPGDVALVFCPMNVQLYVTLLAIFRRGLVAMFVD